MHYGINVHATNSYTIFVHTCNKFWVQAQCFKTQKQTKRHPCLHCRQQLYYAHILANICQIIWFHEKKNNKKCQPHKIVPHLTWVPKDWIDSALVNEREMLVYKFQGNSVLRNHIGKSLFNSTEIQFHEISYRNYNYCFTLSL